ncbi:MAG TPA: ABC transporter ATP-binding protein [Melioribacteraceae bacterium]|nr:ABC transporter ATP-binding protein [Melioribacteraceae bacterium]
MNIIDFDNVSYFYGKNQSEFYLNNICFSINNNEFVSFLGANGSGKSTLLKIAAGLLKPKLGILNLFNKDITEYKRVEIAKLISYVPQLYYSVYPFTVFEIVMMGRNPHLSVLGYEQKEDINFVNEVLDKVGIYNLRNKSINEVSGGEAQRAFIARALAQNSKIILLDEPNSHLDIKNEILLFKLLSLLKEERNISIALITHHLNLANYYSDKILLLKNGNILAYGKPNDVLNKDLIIDCFNINYDINVILNSDNKTINMMPI